MKAPLARPSAQRAHGIARLGLALGDESAIDQPASLPEGFVQARDEDGLARSPATEHDDPVPHATGLEQATRPCGHAHGCHACG
jgi:hypothetical protein